MFLCNMYLYCNMSFIILVVTTLMMRCTRYNIMTCDKVYQCLATGLWFSLGTPVSSTNKTDRHDITEILLKVALNTIAQTLLVTDTQF